MKKIVLIAALAVAAVSASAQDWSKGDWFVGAKTTGLGLDHKFLDKNSATSFDLGVNGGYFLSNRFAVDAALGFASASAKVAGVKESTNAFTYGIGVRYYPISNLFAHVMFEGMSVKDADNNPSYAGIEVGYDFFLSDKVFFEPAVYYKKGLVKKADESNAIGLALGFGVRF